MELEVRHLKLVAAIAAEGSVTRAAQRLHLTQSALSHQLRDLEEHLGTPVFERLSKKMVLTPAGERLLRAAEQVLEELGRAETEIQRAKSGTYELLRLSTHCYTTYHWLPSRLALFERKFPNVEVRIVVEATSDPFEALLQGKLDLAIVHAPVQHRMLSYQPLFQDELVVIVSRKHPLARQTHFPLQAFTDETLLIYPPRERSRVLKDVLNPAGIVPRCIQEVQLTEAMIELVKAGAGVSVLAKWAVAPEIRAGELSALRLTKDGWYRTWSAAMHRNHVNRTTLQEFVNLLAQHPLTKQVPSRKKRGQLVV